MVQDINQVFPNPFKGIQVNYCVSTGCENFGRSDVSLYQLVPNNKALNIYFCPKCGAYPQIINNRAVYETIEHQKRYHALSLTSCPKVECESHQRAVHIHPEDYRSFGKTNSQKQRYQCRCCSTVFTDQLSYVNSHSETQNAMFYGMVYSFGVRNICQKLGITAKTFYKHQRAMVERLKYIAHVKEDAFFRQTEEVHLATGYQFIGKNQGTMLVATAHNPSGYVVAFDSNIITQMSEECLLETSTNPSLNHHVDMKEGEGDLLADITAQYERIMARSNYLDPTSDGRAVQHSHKGEVMQPYLTCFSHALMLRKKMNHKARRYYFVQQDTLLRNAYLNASLEELVSGEDHLFYYRESAREMTWFDREALNIRQVGWWQDKWGFVSNQGKTKGACHIKGPHLPRETWQSLLEQNSLESVEHYLASASDFFRSLGATLNEQSINDWLHIYTGYYNFCWPHKNGKTPAQLLGLFDRPMTLGELLNGYECC